MSVFAPVSILILAMLIMAFLQLTPGVFLLFSHYSYGKFSRKNASNASLFFILGAETSTALVFILIYSLLSSLYVAPVSFTDNLLVWIIAGTMIAIGVIFPFCYFKKGRGTKLFISRRLAKDFDQKTRITKTRSDAFVLGFVASLPELIFTIPVYIVAATQIMKISDYSTVRAMLSLCFILIKIAPLIAIHLTMDSGRNLAILQKSRVKNKQFVRAFISAIYLLIGILMIIFGVFLP